MKIALTIVLILVIMWPLIDGQRFLKKSKQVKSKQVKSKQVKQLLTTTNGNDFCNLACQVDDGKCQCKTYSQESMLHQIEGCNPSDCEKCVLTLPSQCTTNPSRSYPTIIDKEFNYNIQNLLTALADSNGLVKHAMEFMSAPDWFCTAFAEKNICDIKVKKVLDLEKSQFIEPQTTQYYVKKREEFSRRGLSSQFGSQFLNQQYGGGYVEPTRTEQQDTQLDQKPKKTQDVSLTTDSKKLKAEKPIIGPQTETLVDQTAQKSPQTHVTQKLDVKPNIGYQPGQFTGQKSYVSPQSNLAQNTSPFTTGQKVWQQ